MTIEMFNFDRGSQNYAKIATGRVPNTVAMNPVRW